MNERASVTLAADEQQRARHRLALEFGSREEFSDPRFAYRRLFAEVLGTLLLVLAAAGGALLHGKGQIGLANPLRFERPADRKGDAGR